MAKTAKKSGPKKAKRNVPNGVAHIQSTFNNTIVSITDTAGEVIACLLYTSPSPRDKRQSRMPSSA